jgi:hypothetical protein
VTLDRDQPVLLVLRIPRSDPSTTRSRVTRSTKC